MRPPNLPRFAPRPFAALIGVGMASVVGLTTARAGPPPPPAVSLVSFEWGLNGTAGAFAAGNCDPECSDTSSCTDNPGPSFAHGGMVLTSHFEGSQAGRNCGGVCGGAGIGVGYSQTNGSIRLVEPGGGVSPGAVHWSFILNLSSQTGSAGGLVCGAGTGAGQGQASSFWDAVFDAGPGLTLLTMGYTHGISGDSGPNSSAWVVELGSGGGGGTLYFNEALMHGPAGGAEQTSTGTPLRLLPPGRYHARVSNATASQSSTATGGGSRSTYSHAQGYLLFEPYQCAAIVTGPQDTQICALPVGTTSFSVSATGNALAYQWQVADALTAGGWRALVEGDNALPPPAPAGVFTAAFTQAPSVVLSDIYAGAAFPTVSLEVVLRCIVSNQCGPVESQAATLTLCRADTNCSGGLSVQDIFDFLAAYFSGDPRGNFNGVGGISVQDIFDFLAAYFAGCS